MKQFPSSRTPFVCQYAENTGAFLSLGSSLPDPWRRVLFTLLVALLLLVLLLYTLFGRTLPANHALVLALICAGGISNLIDRMIHGGRVVDFLNMGIGPLRTGIFNVADMAIAAGAVLLARNTLTRGTKDSPA